MASASEGSSRGSGEIRSAGLDLLRWDILDIQEGEQKKQMHISL